MVAFIFYFFKLEFHPNPLQKINDWDETEVHFAFYFHGISFHIHQHAKTSAMRQIAKD